MKKIMTTKNFICNNLHDLPKTAKQIMQFFGNSKIFTITGNMGAGKTTLIKKICELKKVKEIVNSPTFSIVNEYNTVSGEKIYHFDFYRINNINEVYDIGYEDYFYSGNYCLIEWAEKIQELLPEKRSSIHIIENTDGSRVFECSYIN
jgi:tRNA threonylcarbamoyladenosine biosynthesis protein TsaE